MQILLVKDGKIAAILGKGHETWEACAKVLDAAGKQVFPGATIPRTSFNDPGLRVREDQNMELQPCWWIYDDHRYATSNEPALLQF